MEWDVDTGIRLFLVVGGLGLATLGYLEEDFTLLVTGVGSTLLGLMVLWQERREASVREEVGVT